MEGKVEEKKEALIRWKRKKRKVNKKLTQCNDTTEGRKEKLCKMRDDNKTMTR